MNIFVSENRFTRIAPIQVASRQAMYRGKSNGGSSEGGSRNNRFALKPDVTIASDMLIFSKNSLAITDFLAKKTQLTSYCGKPPSWTPPPDGPKIKKVRDFERD